MQIAAKTPKTNSRILIAISKQRPYLLTNNIYAGTNAVTHGTFKDNLIKTPSTKQPKRLTKGNARRSAQNCGGLVCKS